MHNLWAKKKCNSTQLCTLSDPMRTSKFLSIIKNMHDSVLKRLEIWFVSNLTVEILLDNKLKYHSNCLRLYENNFKNSCKKKKSINVNIIIVVVIIIILVQ